MVTCQGQMFATLILWWRVSEAPFAVTKATGGGAHLHSIVCSPSVLCDPSEDQASKQWSPPITSTSLHKWPLDSDLKEERTSLSHRGDAVTEAQHWPDGNHHTEAASSQPLVKKTKHSHASLTDATPTTAEQQPRYHCHLWWMCVARKTNGILINKTFFM